MSQTDKRLTELVIIAEQLRRPDGRFQFQVRWEVGRSRNYKSLRTSRRSWSAGSVEEMLAAIEAAYIALERMPGIKPAQPTKRCGRCGQILRPDGHPDDVCAAAILRTKQPRRRKYGL